MLIARGMEKQAVWFASPRELERLREHCPECIMMPDPGPEKFLAKLIERLQPRVVAAVWRHYSKTFAETCHAAGAIVIVDEDEPDCWDDALAWGSDGIQTDHPEELVRYLQQRAENE